jgi:hypothetical protein
MGALLRSVCKYFTKTSLEMVIRCPLIVAKPVRGSYEFLSLGT